MFRSKNSLPFFMWFFPVSFFTFQFILRLWPGLMMHQIMEQYAIDASHFGVLAALYYYGYAGMQIPVAVMLERFGARYVVFAFALICGIATLLFTYTTNWYIAGLSRFLIGLGSAAGFLATSKVISEWFPQSRYAKMVGLTFTIGLLGAIYGGRPVSLLISHHDWKHVALILALVAIGLGIAAYCFLRSPSHSHNDEKTVFQWSHFKKLLSLPAIWILALANFLMVGALEGFADVWGVPFLTTAYEMSKVDAAQLISFIFFGMLFGGPLLAFLSKKIGNYAVISLCGLVICLAFKLLLSNTHYSWYYLALILFTIGVVCCYQVIVFAAGSQLVESKLLGVTVAFLNCINMLGGSFFHTHIGQAMDATWSGSMGVDGLHTYTHESYEAALALIPNCAFVGTCLVAMVGLYSYWRNSRVLKFS